MAGFTVDCDELVRAATELRAVHADIVGDAGAHAGTVAEVDHAELAAAIQHFQDNSGQAVDLLCDDVAAVADRLADNAANYLAAQQRTLATLAGLVD